MAFLVQILHRFEGDVATTVEGQVLAAGELSRLVGLATFALQGDVATGLDLAADVANVSYFVALGFLRAEAAFLLHVVQQIVTVLGRQDVKILAGIEVGLIGRLYLARHQGQVALFRDQVDVPPCRQSGDLLVDVVFLAGNLFALAVAVGFVGRCDQGEDVLGGQGRVTTGAEGAGDGGEVAAGTDAQVTPRREAAGQLGDAGTGVVGTAATTRLGLGADQVDVAAGDQGGVATCAQNAADVVDIAPGNEAQAVAGFDTSGAVGVVFSQALAGITCRMGSDGTFVEDVAAAGRQADVTSTDDAARAVTDVAQGAGEAQPIAGLDQAAVDQVVGGGSREVVGGSQGAGVGQVIAGDQGDVAYQVDAAKLRITISEIAWRANPSLALA